MLFGHLTYLMLWTGHKGLLGSSWCAQDVVGMHTNIDDQIIEDLHTNGVIEGAWLLRGLRLKEALVSYVSLC